MKINQIEVWGKSTHRNFNTQERNISANVTKEKVKKLIKNNSLGAAVESFAD